jgi:hypothetical protein
MIDSTTIQIPAPPLILVPTVLVDNAAAADGKIARKSTPKVVSIARKSRVPAKIPDHGNAE